MAYVVLDIGAGSKSFGRTLKRKNPHVRMLVLCGEPEWRFWPLIRPTPPEKVLKLLEQKHTGLYRIVAQYEEFGLPDNSLDLVALNSPHPFMGPSAAMAGELLRCLNPGGHLFSSFSEFDLAPVPCNFEKIAEGRWRDQGEILMLKTDVLPACAPHSFPQSTTVNYNIRAHRDNDPRIHNSDYVYSGGISPGWSLWKKHG